MYGKYLKGLRRATTFYGRRRQGSPRLGHSTTRIGAIVRKGRRTWRPENRPAWVDFLHLTWPAIIPVLLCLAAQFAPKSFLTAYVPLLPVLPILVLPMALVATVRAGASATPLKVRILAMLVCASPTFYIAYRYVVHAA